MTEVLDSNAWKKQIRRNVVDSITAVHEAGHVVARMLAFEDFGHSLDVFKAGGWVHTLQPPRWLYNDGLTYPQGPISAPFFSYEMERVSEELRKNYDRDWNTYDEYMAKVVQVSKAAGVSLTVNSSTLSVSGSHTYTVSTDLLSRQFSSHHVSGSVGSTTGTR